MEIKNKELLMEYKGKSNMIKFKSQYIAKTSNGHAIKKQLSMTITFDRQTHGTTKKDT